ncbi:hypothetical protein Tco_1308553 [Tanacetum coccineum]
MIDSRLENIGRAHISIPPPVPFEQLLDNFMNPPDELVMDDLESDTKSYETPLVSPFLDSDDESDDGEVINELNEVSTSSPTDSTRYGGSGTCGGGSGTAGGGGTAGGCSGEGDLDLLRDNDGKSDGGGEDDDSKSDGGGEQPMSK